MPKALYLVATVALLVLAAATAPRAGREVCAVDGLTTTCGSVWP